MLSFLPAPLVGFISITLYFSNLGLWTIVLCTTALIRAIIPVKRWRKFWTDVIHTYPGRFNQLNNLIMKLTMKTKVVVPNFPAAELDINKSYLLVSNHQSWTDILILLKVFNLKIPVFKFFIKKQLLWLPLVGLGAWIMDYPFMERHSKEQIQKNPSLKGKDFESALRACEKFKDRPTTIINFSEGTRYTKQKHDRQKSPFTNLLRPKAGGSALVFKAIGNTIDKLLDVTIIYPEGRKSAWDFACGKIDQIVIYVNAIPVSEIPQGDYENDPNFRSEFQQYINALWVKKDQLISSVRHAQQNPGSAQLNLATD